MTRQTVYRLEDQQGYGFFTSANEGHRRAFDDLVYKAGLFAGDSFYHYQPQFPNASDEVMANYSMGIFSKFRPYRCCCASASLLAEWFPECTWELLQKHNFVLARYVVGEPYVLHAKRQSIFNPDFAQPHPKEPLCNLRKYIQLEALPSPPPLDILFGPSCASNEPIQDDC